MTTADNSQGWPLAGLGNASQRQRRIGTAGALWPCWSLPCGARSDSVATSHDVKECSWRSGRHMMKPWKVLIATALLVGSPGVALAQPASAEQASDGDKAIARQLTSTGLDALDRRDYPAAETALARAESLYWAPTIGLGFG